MAEENNKEIENLKKQNEEYLNGWKRAKADYLNLRKDMDAQGREIKGWMSKIMILPILNVMDGLDKAFETVPENLKNDNWVKGVEAVKKQLEDHLKAQKVEAMKVFGEKFDPAKHEAVESASPPAGEGASGKVAEEILKGYFIDGEVLRPAKVKVYK